MRGLALVGALLLTTASLTRADGEGAVDLDLDAFADHLTDALAGEDDDVAVDAWEERLEPQAEDDWVAARGPREPEVDHPGPGQRAATVGLTVRLGDDLAITRLVFADAARTTAFARRVVAGHLALPLGVGPSGRAIPIGAILIEPRGRDLLVIRVRAVDDVERALTARAAAWLAPGTPEPTTSVEGLAMVDRDLLAFTWRDAERARGWLGPEEAEVLVRAAADAKARPCGARARGDRSRPAIELSSRLDRALGLPEER